MAGKRKERFSVVLGAVDKISEPIRKINRRIESMMAPIQKLKRKMKSLSKEAGFGKLGSSIAGVGKQLARLGAGAVLAFAGLFRALDRTSESMDLLAKTTRALDFPVAEFQRWKQVSQLAGVGAENFDKSIKKLSKNIGELRLNTGTMSTILDKADPAFKKQLQNSKSNAEAFELVIKRMRSLTNAQDQAALAQAAFGRGGMELINVAKMTAAEVANLKSQVEENGGIISAESLANAEAFQDSLLLMKTALGNLWAEIAGNLFPVVQEIMAEFKEWAVRNKEVIQTNITAFLLGFIDAGKQMLALMQEWGPPMLGLIKKLGGLKFVLGVLAVVVLLPLVATIGAVGAAFGTVGGAIALAVAGIGAAIAAVIANWEDLKAAFFDSKVGGFLSDTFNAMGGAASLQSASVAAAQFAPGAVVPGASQSSNVDVNIKIDQDGRVTGVEPETGSAVKVTSESLNGEAF
jgi:hypothetical protein